ncbi:hypothetical protein [Croceibacterium ferulae]|uniref:hypothetical protein n=1 Tax=Croceibacterium ferulae TaxID=1854641 RepID=UPI0019D4778B|nr:hypothetical protein [Croceibacterium ferulae]
MAGLHNAVAAVERFKWVAGGLNNPRDAAIVQQYAAEMALLHAEADWVCAAG